MKTFRIIHLRNPYDQAATETLIKSYVKAAMTGDVESAIIHDLYAIGPLVEARDPEDLFKSTQNIDEPWARLRPPLDGDPEQRSTSVGDIIFDTNTQDFFVCQVLGWEKAGPDIQSLLNDRHLTQ